MFRIGNCYWKQENHPINSTNNTIRHENLCDRRDELGENEAGLYLGEVPQAFYKSYCCKVASSNFTDLQHKKHKLKVGSHFGLIILNYFIIYTCMPHVYISTLKAVVNCLRQLNVGRQIVF